VICWGEQAHTTTLIPLPTPSHTPHAPNTRANPTPHCNRRCIKIALVHDVAESLVGDITPHCGVSEEEKHRLEAEAVATIQGMLGRETQAGGWLTMRLVDATAARSRLLSSSVGAFETNKSAPLNRHPTATQPPPTPRQRARWPSSGASTRTSRRPRATW
jgi:hypothetical protein